MTHEKIKMRVLAKRFVSSIPNGFAVQLPDEVMDNLTDEQCRTFIEQLKTLRVVDEGNGKWSKKR